MYGALGQKYETISMERSKKSMGKKWDKKDYDGVLGGRFMKTSPPKNKYIRKWAQMVTDEMFVHVGYDNPAYYGLAAFGTEEMAKIALKMKVRKAHTFDEIQKMTGIEPKHLQEVLDRMNYMGLLEYDWENPKKEKQYTVKTFVPGTAEMLNMRPDNYKDHPEVAEFFELETYLPLAGITQMIPPGGAGTGMHAIPVEKAIESVPNTNSLEHISHWLEKYDGHIAVGPCSCRLERAERGVGCADDPNFWCIGLGEFADYCNQSKFPGHYITKEEALEILKKAEDNGFVHQTTNIDGEDKIFGICNCNPQICNALRTSMLYNTPNLTASAYRAKVDPENCVACGRCVEFCPAGAVRLGRKLNLKDGSQYVYPKAELPDNQRWGSDHWNPNYRDDNREECYDSGTAPCKSACPAHIAIQGYLQMAKEGRYDEALALIKRENPFPAVCGRVCNRKCEEACTRGTIDEAVAIDEVKKYIAQQDLFADTRYVPEIITASDMKDVYDEKIAIIGGGPAGLSCAYYLATRGYKPTVFEKNEKPGGMLTYGIPSYKLEKDVVDAEIDVLRQLGVEIRTGVEVGKDVTIQQLRDQGYLGFYLAIGCQGSRKAGVPGEDADGISSAIEHLKKIQDDPDYRVKGKTVVIGGGNVAIDAARTSTRLGAEEVSMFCLEQRKEMPASLEEIMEAESEDVNINCGWGPKEFIKDENGAVKAVVFKKCISVFDENKKFNPQYDEDDTITVEADTVITSIGQCIDWGGILNGETGMEYVHGNYPKADPVTYQTSIPDIFVGGDVYHGPSFAINAIAEGHEAAESLHRWVQPTAHSLTLGRPHRHFIEMDKNNLQVLSYDNSKRQKPELKSGIDSKTSFKEYVNPFTEEQVKLESKRCLSCGASVVDENKCIGCGICTTKCAFDAIHLERTHPEATDYVPCEDRMKKVIPYAIKRAGRIAVHDVKKAFGKK